VFLGFRPNLGRMNTLDLLMNHRSIRKFTEEPVTDEMVESIIRAGLFSATSSNLQGATVIRVRNPEKRTAIATLAGGQSYVETAGAFFVWCADLHRSSVACEMAEGSFVPGVTEHFIIAVVDCVIAAQSAVAASESLGLGICYIGGIRNDPAQMTELLELPDQVVPLFGMCIGWPDQNPDRKPRLPLSVTLKEDRYDESGDVEGIRAYDERMREYYRVRTQGKVDRTWTADMSGPLGKESRPHMRRFLADQGFTFQ
jgi:nitroreductase